MFKEVTQAFNDHLERNRRVYISGGVCFITGCAVGVLIVFRNIGLSTISTQNPYYMVKIV